MTIRVKRAVAVMLALAAIPAVCAGQTPRPAVDVLKADIDAVVAAPDGGADRQIKVVDVGKLNVGVGVLTQGARKTAPGEAVAGISHAQVTEVYYVLSGSGVLITGTEIAAPVPLDPASDVVKVAVGPSHRATFMGAMPERWAAVTDIRQTLRLPLGAGLGGSYDCKPAGGIRITSK